MFGKKKNAPPCKWRKLQQDSLFVREKDIITEEVFKNLLHAHDAMSNSYNVDVKGYVKLTKYLFKLIKKRENILIGIPEEIWKTTQN